MLLAWLAAFSLTLAIESPIDVALLRRHDHPSRLLALACFANLATHPCVWFVFPTLPLPYPFTVALSEAFALLAEAAFFRLTLPQAGWRNAALASLVANTASFCAGLLLWAWLR